MSTLRRTFTLTILALASLLMVGALALASGDHDGGHHDDDAQQETMPHDDHGSSHHGSDEGNLHDYVADKSFTFRTEIVEGGFAFVGVGGDIDGEVNPRLHLHHGEVIEIVLINGDGVEHDFHIPSHEAMSDHIDEVGEETRLAFRVGDEGEYEYTCALPGHKEAGMVGMFEVAAAHN